MADQPPAPANAAVLSVDIPAITRVVRNPGLHVELPERVRGTPLNMDFYREAQQAYRRVKRMREGA
jgi:hypothetical protein